jgi:hypothetical protein
MHNRLEISAVWPWAFILANWRQRVNVNVSDHSREDTGAKNWLNCRILIPTRTLWQIAAIWDRIPSHVVGVRPCYAGRWNHLRDAVAVVSQSCIRKVDRQVDEACRVLGMHMQVTNLRVYSVHRVQRFIRQTNGEGCDAAGTSIVFGFACDSSGGMPEPVLRMRPDGGTVDWTLA